MLIVFLGSATAAADSAAAAATSATNAANSASAASLSVTDAESARDQSQAARDTAEDHKLAAEAAATSATNTASALTGFDLDAIAASKAVTAVDVFVYDTSRDSDGGAWRKRTQHTSWYNETLNTATRGARREFPAVAVIVAELRRSRSTMVMTLRCRCGWCFARRCSSAICCMLAGTH
jgi:trimeric autotransporter adhesin